MSRTIGGGAGSDGLARGLEELLTAVYRSIAAYELAEPLVHDHRIQAAISHLRQDHERHAEELSQLWNEIVVGAGLAPAEPLAPDVVEPAPMVQLVRDGGTGGASVLDAIRAAEAEMQRLYETHVSRNYMELVRAALTRHQREEEAHVAFLRELEFWQSPIPVAPEPEGTRRPADNTGGARISDPARRSNRAGARRAAMRADGTTAQPE